MKTDLLVDDESVSATCERPLEKRLDARTSVLGLLFFSAAAGAFAGVNRWTTHGPTRPFGAFVSSLAVDPADPRTVYAGTAEEVFKSSDGGSSWTTSLSHQAGGGGAPSGLAIEPLHSTNVYAATDKGVFRSTDAGGSWTSVPLPVSNTPAYSVALDPATPSTILVGTAGGLFKSTDRGASWGGRLVATSIYSLLFSPQSPSTIFGADIQYSDTDSSDSYYPPPPTCLIHRSTNAGTTWSNTDTGIYILPGALAVDPEHSSTLYAGTPDGVYKSVNSGSNWWRLGRDPGPAIITAVAIDPKDPSTLYAADYDRGGVIRSTDGGVSWHGFNHGLTNRGVAALAIDPTGTRLYAGTTYGVYAYQIVPGPGEILDVSVGTDDKTRVLFSGPDNGAFALSFDNSGNSTSQGPYGPYEGWKTRAVADGLDGLTRVLWSNPDGSAALWLLRPTDVQASFRFGPAAGWTAVDVSVDTNGTSHLLWTSVDGRTGLLSVAVSGAVVNRVTYGPFRGWLARSIATGADGLTRVLWTKTDGTVGLSLTDGGELVAAYRFAGEPGWTARDLTVASDNQTRILLVHTDGRMVVRSVDNSGAVTNSGRVYEPVSGQAASRISAGADGLIRVLWTSPEATGSVWLMDLDNVLQESFSFGGGDPCAGCWDY